MSARIAAMLRRLLPVLVVLAGLFGGTGVAFAQSSEGTDFWLGFTPNGGAPEGGELALGISSKMGATVTVTATPGKSSTASTFTETFTLAPNQSRLVTLPSALMLDRNMNHLVDRGSVHVMASAPVSVHARNWDTFSSDSYLALPTPGLGNQYAVVTAASRYGAESKVIAAQDNTTVTLFARGAAKAGDGSVIPAGGSRTLTLQRGETALFYVTGNGSDLTGARVVADKPIAVVAANNCAEVPDGLSFCDYIADQLPPVSSLGQSYLLVPTQRDIIGDVVRVLAVADDTAVYRNGALHRTLLKGESYEFFLDTPADLRTSQPAVVAQYLRSTFVGGLGDPSVMLAVPTAQFMRRT